MIFRNEKSNGQQQPAVARSPVQPADIPQAIPTARLIGADVRIVGDVTGDHEIQVDGTVEGNVTCPVIVVGEPGYVKGNLKGDTVMIGGAVNGHIDTRSLALNATARVEGKVDVQDALTIEHGVDFRGIIERQVPSGPAAAAISLREPLELTAEQKVDGPEDGDATAPTAASEAEASES